MIIQIRGTSGSGKSWVVHQLLKRWYFSPVYISRWGKRNRRIPLYYEAFEGNIIVCGNYNTVCGGCDSIGSARYVFDLYTTLKVWYPRAVIISEGLLLSEDVKWTREAYRRGWNPTVYYLTTTPDACIRQVNERRQAAGRDPLENEANTRLRVEVIERSRLKLEETGVATRQLAAPLATYSIYKEATRCILNKIGSDGSMTTLVEQLNATNTS